MGGEMRGQRLPRDPEPMLPSGPLYLATAVARWIIPTPIVVPMQPCARLYFKIVNTSVHFQRLFVGMFADSYSA